VACAASKDWSHMSMEELMEALLARGQDPIGSKEKLAERLAALEESEDSDDSETEDRPRPKLRGGQQWRLRERPTFPDCGPMPDISLVRINDLEQELRRRGVPIVGYRKQDLYDLVQLAMERKSQALTLSDDELARWLLERGVLPQGTREELTALVSAGMVAETGGSVGSEFGSFTRDDLLDPSFDPSELTIPQLRGILRGFNASTLGRKAELVDRVSGMLEVASMGLHAPQSALALSDKKVKMEARRIVDTMSVEECRQELRRRGHSEEGPPERVQERLQLVLIVDSQRQATGQALLRGTAYPPNDVRAFTPASLRAACQ
jgi:predicted HTH domain antitoxin